MNKKILIKPNKLNYKIAVLHKDNNRIFNRTIFTYRIGDMTTITISHIYINHTRPIKYRTKIFIKALQI